MSTAIEARFILISRNHVRNIFAYVLRLSIPSFKTFIFKIGFFHAQAIVRTSDGIVCRLSSIITLDIVIQMFELHMYLCAYFQS